MPSGAHWLDANDEAIQVGIIDLDSNVLLNTLFRPTVLVAPEARSVHGITDKELIDASHFSDLYDSNRLWNRLVKEEDGVPLQCPIIDEPHDVPCKHHYNAVNS